MKWLKSEEQPKVKKNAIKFWDLIALVFLIGELNIRCFSSCHFLCIVWTYRLSLLDRNVMNRTVLPLSGKWVGFFLWSAQWVPYFVEAAGHDSSEIQCPWDWVGGPTSKVAPKPSVSLQCVKATQESVLLGCLHLRLESNSA